MNCERCGVEMDSAIIHKREVRGIYDKRCSDCRMKPSRKINYEDDYCMPHKGELDAEFNPIDNKGRPYLPGLRTCGHKDCIRKTHIIREPRPQRNPEWERLDISYRTGRRFNLQEALKEAS